MKTSVRAEESWLDFIPLEADNLVELETNSNVRFYNNESSIVSRWWSIVLTWTNKWNINVINWTIYVNSNQGSITSNSSICIEDLDLMIYPEVLSYWKLPSELEEIKNKWLELSKLVTKNLVWIFAPEFIDKVFEKSDLEKNDRNYTIKYEEIYLRVGKNLLTINVAKNIVLWNWKLIDEAIWVFEWFVFKKLEDWVYKIKFWWQTIIVNRNEIKIFKSN